VFGLSVTEEGFAKPIVVFAYDFDGTLAPGNMQEHSFLPEELEINNVDFWEEVKELARIQRGDEAHAYMYLMLKKAREKGISLHRQSWRDRGKSLRLFPGVKDWFKRQSDIASNEHRLDLRHFIISSGNRELIEGSPISRFIEKIYASAFMFEQDKATGVALSVDYTAKTQFLFRINKWKLDEWDRNGLNSPMELASRPVPFSRIVFFGDGESDVPIMKLLTDQGGYSVATYEPKSARAANSVKGLRVAGRAKYAAPADYRSGTELDLLTKAILTEIAAREAAGRLVRWPEEKCP
jgi:hypothetical protein